MSSWMNDAAVPNQNGNGFPNINDPSMMTGAMMDPSAFMASGPQFNAAQFANPQQMAAMTNGQMRNASPSFSNPVYQTNSVIPAKRPRPREDSVGQSPRQNPNMLPTSRSETPQQAQFANFPQGQGASGQPSPYPAHMQTNGSANATPSPIMANQMRPGSVPQRVSTTSPHPFSPAAPQFATQPSPIASEHGGTPTPNTYMQQGNIPANFNPNFNPAQSPASRPAANPNAMAGQMTPQQMQMAQMQAQMAQMAQMGQIPAQMQNSLLRQQMAAGQMAPTQNAAMEQQKLLYQMSLQNQLGQTGVNPQMAGQGMMPAQMQAQAAARQAQVAAAQNRNMMAARQGMPNGQMPPGGMRPQGLPQHPILRLQSLDQFIKQLGSFMNSRQLPLEVQPTIAGKGVNLMVLFQTVFKNGGYHKVTQANVWPQVSMQIGFAPSALPTAPQLIKVIYEKNLFKFEEVIMMQMQKARAQQVQAGAQVAMGMPQQQPGQPQRGGPQRMPSGQLPPGQAQAQGQMPGKPGMQTPVNGFQPQQPPSASPKAKNQEAQARASVSGQGQQQPSAEELAVQSPTQLRTGSMPMPGAPQQPGEPMAIDGAALSKTHMAPVNEDEYVPNLKFRRTYGGYDIGVIAEMGAELDAWRVDIPPANELGNVDIHALSKSLQSGIHGEIRMALDTLATVTISEYQALVLDLRYCEDLLEALTECAEDQVEVLAEHAAEVSDEIDMPPFEDVFRACKLEKTELRKVPVFGTEEYELDRAVDRLICITTILRNLSFIPVNQRILADETVVKFICVVIRYLGTRSMLLRTQSNALDFMKDIVTFLSNISSFVEIPSREEALQLLQFLLAFAPTPTPDLTAAELFFTPYNPSLQPYLPAAIDSLAKLLARDEPNRTQFRNIFAEDATTTPPSELLTRAFALAIAPIPDQNHDLRPHHVPTIVEVRKPILMQGLLASDILASLAPGYETGVTRAWLSATNGFAQNLFRLIRSLSAQYEGPPPRAIPANPRAMPKKDDDLVYIVGLAASMLRKLTEKTRDPADPESIPSGVLPAREAVLGALQMGSAEWRESMLVDLLAFAALDD